MKTKLISLLLTGLIITNFAKGQSCCDDNNGHDNCSMRNGEHEMSHRGQMKSHHGQVMGMSLMGSAEYHNVANEFRQQLRAIYKSTLDLNNSFVKSDLELVTRHASTVASLVNAIDMKMLKSEEHMAWMKQSHVLSISLNSISSSENLERQRASFAVFNQALYAAIKTFGVDETVYFQYCSMADANWLSASENIRNPYYGHQMLTCGTTAEIIN